MSALQGSELRVQFSAMSGIPVAEQTSPAFSHHCSDKFMNEFVLSSSPHEGPSGDPCQKDSIHGICNFQEQHCVVRIAFCRG